MKKFEQFHNQFHSFCHLKSGHTQEYHHEPLCYSVLISFTHLQLFIKCRATFAVYIGNLITTTFMTYYQTVCLSEWRVWFNLSLLIGLIELNFDTIEICFYSLNSELKEFIINVKTVSKTSTVLVFWPSSFINNSRTYYSSLRITASKLKKILHWSEVQKKHKRDTGLELCRSVIRSESGAGEQQ